MPCVMDRMLVLHSPNLDVGALTPSVTVFGGGTSKGG